MYKSFLFLSPQDEENHEQTTDVRTQLRFFEQLERMEKQRKDEQEREILLKAAKVAKLIWECEGQRSRLITFIFIIATNMLMCSNSQSRARQEDPEQARLKQKAKEVRLSRHSSSEQR